MFITRRAVRGACVSLIALGLSAGGPPGIAGAAEPEKAAPARGSIGPGQLRRLIDQEVGGIDKLKVPPTDADIPIPRRPDGSVDPRYVTTEAKRYLGKMLFHDPVRSVRIRPEFGGILATRQTASCASCHLGEAASKAGTLINLAVGAEGRGYTDADGNFIPRRRPLATLPVLRRNPRFAGDVGVDALPTLTDVYEFAIGTPARGRKEPDPGQLLRSGRFDALDSVARNAPSVIGAAFNNRLLLGGFAGEPDSSPGGLNPFGDPAQENLTLLLLDAHRMLEDQSAVLQQIPPFVKLFEDAFPEEAATARAGKDMNVLINDETVFRATATFLRTTVTRNTPFDRFLAGDDRALTAAQRRGARAVLHAGQAGRGWLRVVPCRPDAQQAARRPGRGGRRRLRRGELLQYRAARPPGSGAQPDRPPGSELPRRRAPGDHVPRQRCVQVPLTHLAPAQGRPVLHAQRLVPERARGGRVLQRRDRPGSDGGRCPHLLATIRLPARRIGTGPGPQPGTGQRSHRIPGGRALRSGFRDRRSELADAQVRADLPRPRLLAVSP